MSRTLTAADRSALIRLASTLPKGSEERRAILAGLKSASEMRIVKRLDDKDTGRTPSGVPFAKLLAAARGRPRKPFHRIHEHVWAQSFSEPFGKEVQQKKAVYIFDERDGTVYRVDLYSFERAYTDSRGTYVPAGKRSEIWASEERFWSESRAKDFAEREDSGYVVTFIDYYRLRLLGRARGQDPWPAGVPGDPLPPLEQSAGSHRKSRSGKYLYEDAVALGIDL